ncbi:MAG: ABC transporter permease [Christensenellaceae bacterium]|jgi:putative ABC transport system permease protein|nr:ABC transporter permease [Christensenellaceae bacterium]
MKLMLVKLKEYKNKRNGPKITHGMFFKHVATSVLSNRTRVLLTFLGIVISSLVFCIAVLRFDLQYKQLQLNYSNYPQNVVVAKGKLNPVDIINFKTNFSDINVIVGRLDTIGYIEENKNLSVCPIGVKENFLSGYIYDFSNNGGVYLSSLAYGRSFNDAEIKGLESSAIINKTTAKILFGTENPLGMLVRVDYESATQTNAYKIIGVIDDSFGMQSDYSDYINQYKDNINIGIYTPEQNISNKSINYDFSIFYTNNLSLESIFYNEKYIDGEYKLFTNSEISFFSFKDHEKQYNESLESFKSSYGTFVIVIIISEIIALNIFMLFSIKERIEEIGIRKAIGSNNFYIMMQFMLEYFIIGLFGTIIGILCANFINQVFIVVDSIKDAYIFVAPSMTPNIIVFFVSNSIILLTSLIPALIARKTQITDALRFI